MLLCYCATFRNGVSHYFEKCYFILREIFLGEVASASGTLCCVLVFAIIGGLSLIGILRKEHDLFYLEKNPQAVFWKQQRLRNVLNANL